MKVRIHLDTDDYLIILLLFVGAVIAAIGIYTVGASFIEWLTSSLSSINVR